TERPGTTSRTTEASGDSPAPVDRCGDTFLNEQEEEVGPLDHHRRVHGAWFRFACGPITAGAGQKSLLAGRRSEALAVGVHPEHLPLRGGIHQRSVHVGYLG